MRKAPALVALIAALVIPANAFGGYWSWGYNYIGVNVNPFNQSGYNYWYDQYVDKTSGGQILHGFGPGGSCLRIMGSGARSWYGTPGDLGCGGYIFNILNYDSGATSYVFANSYA